MAASFRVRCVSIVGPLLAAAALLLYLGSLPPALTTAHGGSDGAELAVAVRSLGIPHPTGYPTFVLLAQSFRALPWGSLAVRLSLFSALAAALAVGLVGAAAADLLGPAERPRPALVGGVTAGASLAVAGLFWSQAVMVEVYALHTFFLALCCWLLLRWRRRGGSYLPLAGLALGLGLGNHLSLLFLLPAAVLFVSWAWRCRQGRVPFPDALPGRGKGPAPVPAAADAGSGRPPAGPPYARREIAVALVLLLASLAIYLYLPLRAAADPWLNWGAPVGWRPFWAHVGAAAYRHYLFQVPPAAVPGRLSAVAGLLLRDYCPWGLLLGLGGLYLLGQKDRPALALLAVPAGLGLVLAVTYGGANSQVHLLPLYVALSIAGGVAAGAVAQRLEERFPRLGGRLAWLLPALSLVLLVVGWPQWSLRNDPGPLPDMRRRLSALPSGSLLLTDRDEATFPLWYAQVEERSRPDVAIVDVRLLPWPWYRQQLPRRYPGLVVPDATEGTLEALLEANSARPAFALGPLALPGGYRLREEGPVYRIVP